ncbi:MAG: homogentisate 1,2-dioxygenase, partial [Actinomycetota bacterium]|nr:homogentisate 1,2-dioxygenase [Actinomycetota bacterium]
MPYYRQLGEIPRKRHTQFRRPDGGLYAEELQGEEGFSSDSSLLYHRNIPTAIVSAEAVERQPDELIPNHPLKPRHFKTHGLKVGGDLVDGRRLLMANPDVRLSYVAADAASPLYRNAIGDECVYVESGAATFESVYGRMEVGRGDYVVVPTSCTHRWLPHGGEPLRGLVVEAIGSAGHITPPGRYLSRHGQFLEHSPYCERDLRGPSELITLEDAETQVLVKHRTGYTRYTYAHHPFDVVGWDGFMYPYAFNIDD